MIRISSLSLAVGMLAAGCSSSSSPQDISGRVDQPGFPTAVTGVRVIRGTTTIVESPVASDGSFKVTVPAGSGYRIELVSQDQPGLVFPRTTGVIETSFAIKNGTNLFDLGMVRFVGDASTRTYHTETPGDGDVECEDGLDPNGAVCVDDDDEEGAQCEDGTNDGETNDDGADEGDGDGETDDDQLPANAAVAEHNLPASIGCDEGDGDGEEADD